MWLTIESGNHTNAGPNKSYLSSENWTNATNPTKNGGPSLPTASNNTRNDIRQVSNLTHTRPTNALITICVWRKWLIINGMSRMSAHRTLFNDRIFRNTRGSFTMYSNNRFLRDTLTTYAYFRYLLVHGLLALSWEALAYPGWQGHDDNPPDGTLINDVDIADVEVFSGKGPLFAGHAVHFPLLESDL